MSKVPQIRIRAANSAPLQPSGDFILYWMIANRRLRYNFALDRALQYCDSLRKPLLIFEPLRADYPWASDRFHRFVLDGMAENARNCSTDHVQYFPYVEPTSGHGKGLLAALAAHACVVVTDDFPCFFLPKVVDRAARQLSVLLETVDSNGLLPIRAIDQAALRAVDFRRFLQRSLPSHLTQFPAADPLRKRKVSIAAAIPDSVTEKWPMASWELLSGKEETLATLPIDHRVNPTPLRGGSKAASLRMDEFLSHDLPMYTDLRSDPDHDVTSRLSPYLHFGHLSTHELFARVAEHEQWVPEKLSLRANGQRQSWWNMSPSAEAFLDQLITWRELSFNLTAHRPDYDRFESLPDWAQKTLHKHARDQREHIYSLEQYESACTTDPLWNAAQTQLVRDGRIHNYLRMLWGKKILEWTRTPHDALKIMVHLNNKYALDGRDPNSYSGIFWVLGRYDRPWGPERAVFGTVRYMSSANTARKFLLKSYLREHGRIPGPNNDARSLPLFSLRR